MTLLCSICSYIEFLHNLFSININTSFWLLIKIIKLIPIDSTFVFLLTFAVYIHIKCTKTAVSTFVVLNLIDLLLFLCLSEKVTLLSFAYLESWKLIFILFFLLLLRILKCWKVDSRITLFCYILKILKVYWFLCWLSLVPLILMERLILISKLRKINLLII